MKKIIIILALILICVYAALAVLGSRGEYTAEKLFYRAMKTNNKIISNPDVVPPALSLAVENDLKTILKKYPKSNTAKITSITLSEFYLTQKKYDKALGLLNAILKTDNQDVVMASRAQFLKGLVYERQDQWADALREYNILRNKYPNTQIGLQVPLYIGRYYDSKGMQADAQKEYESAVAFYKNIESANRGKMLGYAASNFLGQAYMNLKRYEEAGGTIENMVNNYPSEMTYYQCLPAVEFIYLKTLNRPAKVIEIYKGVQGKTKDAQLKKFLSLKIKDLEKKQQ